MASEYYSVLRNAVVDKDAAARDRIYRDALGLIAKAGLSPEVAATRSAALRAAIRQVEADIAASEAVEANEAAIGEVLSTRRSWLPFAVGGLAIAAVLVAAVLVYGYFAVKGPGNVASGPTPSSAKAQRERGEVAAADLKPGVDGGSTSEGLPFALQRQVVFYRTTVGPGSIVIDRESRFLYLIDANNSARRYAIGIAQECLKSGGIFRVANKLEWPDWRSAGSNARSADELIAAAGRPGSLLGARALLMDKPGVIIHGTNSPKTIGHLVTSGCIRLVNDDVEDLYRRVSVDARVVFVS